MVAVGIGQLELLDSEYHGLRKCGFFHRDPEDGVWLFKDGKAREATEEYQFTLAQRQIYIWWKYVFKKNIYSNTNEVARRIAIVLHGDRKDSSNIHRQMVSISKKTGMKITNGSD